MSTLRSTEKQVSIKAPWGNIAGLTWGDANNPPVLLCHGKLDTCSSFRPLVSLLPECFFYVSIDIPGNGRSDHLPPGVRYSIVDLVPTLVKVMEHYKWEKFAYIGHSLGVVVGKFFDMAYPGRITRAVELDPIPAHHTWECTRQEMRKWYEVYYEYYQDRAYEKHNGGPETAPKYSYEQARSLIMKSRGVSKESADLVLERCLEPAGDGLYRLTNDQRMKNVTVLPFSGEALRQIYTTTSVPIFCVLAKDIIDHGIYKPVPFLMDPKAWQGSYKFKIVAGGHDVHLNNYEEIAGDVSKFLLEGYKTKL